MALDLSAKIDLCALVAVSATNHSRARAWFWKPADYLEDHERRDRVPYRVWAAQGRIEAAPGRSIHPRAVAMVIAELVDRYDVLGLAYDRWGISNLLRRIRWDRA